MSSVLLMFSYTHPDRVVQLLCRIITLRSIDVAMEPAEKIELLTICHSANLQTCVEQSMEEMWTRLTMERLRVF